MLKLVKDSIRKERDLRTHEDRLLALREAFGELKEKAIQKKKVNECSVTKVADKAGVNKIYLTGNKQFAKPGIAEKYRLIGQSILRFREDFQTGKVLIESENKSKSLEVELVEVKSSVYQYFLQLETSKSVSENDRSKLKEAENRIIILQAKIAQMVDMQGTHKLEDKSVRPFIDALIRTVICPDKHLIVNGKYIFHDEDLRNKSWLKAYDELEDALSRSFAKRLYVLVGLPCSGKTTWANSADLYPDRHPIIFDSTNLTRFDRENLVHRIKRFTNVRKCCVFFDTPMTVIWDRNTNNRTRDKQLSEVELNLKKDQLQIPNPHEEKWIEEMIVVRDSK